MHGQAPLTKKQGLFPFNYVRALLSVTTRCHVAPGASLLVVRLLATPPRPCHAKLRAAPKRGGV